jgi:hypothetical protein
MGLLGVQRPTELGVLPHPVTVAANRDHVEVEVPKPLPSPVVRLATRSESATCADASLLMGGNSRQFARGGLCRARTND